MPNTLNIRRRIRSVKNTRQITKAMELVAATKMRRSQSQALKSRTYALLAWDMLESLKGKIREIIHPLLRKAEKPKSAVVILLSSNRGLAGSFNAQIVGKTLQYINFLKNQHPGIKVELVVSGKKGAREMVKAQQAIIADFEKIDVDIKMEQILPLARLVSQRYINHECDIVSVGYMDFISTIRHEPRLKQLLPFGPIGEAAAGEAKDGLGKATSNAAQDGDAGRADRKIIAFDYLFEPKADTVLETLLPRLLEMQLYQAVLETNASEHSARMVAMKNASDAAADLIDDLTLNYNQIRQASITQEIAEISAGSGAVA